MSYNDQKHQYGKKQSKNTRKLYSWKKYPNLSIRTITVDMPEPSPASDGTVTLLQHWNPHNAVTRKYNTETP